MEETFRSRGIRLTRINNQISQQMKIYYEPTNISVECDSIRMWSEKGLISLFEYSTVQNHIDTYNYHLNLIDNHYDEIYTGLDKNTLAVLKEIPAIFDDSFQNYTVGYRINNNQIYDSSYYYYPTIWKENRYGIKGIVDKKIINQEVQQFAKYVAKEHYEVQQEIIRFGQIMTKLKGVSVHYTGTISGFKLYGRCSTEILNSFLLYTMGTRITEFQQYGDVILVAQRIQNGMVSGYNLYYKK